ncbi:prolyl oligopeptidase family serine peptidase [Streptomyces sp. NPDC019224]|uniref:prolyl oligopeptidase family serine peptidase n=1 Tax=Streptomyces sp. NPDC019224 TaxID=3154484 RepID=UPI00340C4C0F
MHRATTVQTETQVRRQSVALSRDGRWICLLQYGADEKATLLVGSAAKAVAGCFTATLRTQGRRILARFSWENRLFHCTDDDLAAATVRIHDPALGQDDTMPLAVSPSEEVLGFVPVRGTGPEPALVAKVGTGTAVQLQLHESGRSTVLTPTDRPVSIEAITTTPLQPDNIWYAATGYDTPPSVHHIDLGRGSTAVYRAAAKRVNLSPLEQIQTSYESFDGVRIPLTLLGQPGLLDRRAPTILYVYGGFRTALLPRYMAAPSLWTSAGGTYAIAHVRGGGEFGPAWHHAGSGDAKLVSVRDYLAAAHRLIELEICRPDQLVGEGESNGGLVVAAALTTEPALLGVALITSPVTDLLRFHQSGAGRNWLAEYGNPDDPADRILLRQQSPLHNVHPGVPYPAVLISSWSGDRRVDALHARKFCAALQDAGDGHRPTILQDVLAAGHGARTTADGQSLAADRLAFAAHWTGLNLTDSPLIGH